jgi:pimeloyl-ACP methyl ester carboxylesterase
VLRSLSNHLCDLLPDARRLEIHGASHRMDEENPAAVNDAILGLIDQGR